FRTMNKSTLTLFFALLGPIVAPGFAAPAPELSVRLDLPYTSRYVYRGVQLAKDSIQPSLDLSVNDSYLGAWFNSPVAAGQKNEFDFYLGHDFAADDLGKGGKLDLGGRVYHFPQGFYTAGLGNTSYEIYAGLLGGPIAQGPVPAIYSYYDFTRKSYNFIGSLSAALPVEKLGFALRFDVHAGYAGFNRAIAGKGYTYWGAGVSLPYRIASNATFTVGAQYDSSSLTGAKHNLTTFTAGVTLGF
ncbi:MAG: TorF family putative porin, partial [Verrucomicrobiota bacterium]